MNKALQKAQDQSNQELANQPDELPIDTPGIEVWDELNPRSVINLLPDYAKSAMLTLKNDYPQYVDVEEGGLRTRLRDEKRQINPTDHRLRYQFWIEYDNVQRFGMKHMVLGRVCRGVCSDGYFRKTYLKEPYKLAWMLCPPTHYLTKVTEALDFATAKLREILELPVEKKNGKIDYSLVKIQMAIQKQLDAQATNREPGPGAQHIHIHNAPSATASQITDAATKISEQVLHEQIRDMRTRNERLRNGGVLDVHFQKVEEPKVESEAGAAGVGGAEVSDTGDSR